MNKTIGLIAAPYTPFTQKGEINLNLISKYADKLKQDNVQGVFVNGTTGEGVSLSMEERIKTAEAWIHQKTDQFKVFIHTGHNSLENSKNLAAHAQHTGADAIGAMGPTFFKFENLETMVRYNASIAQAASELPYYYYHIPVMTGAYFPMYDFLQMAEKEIPNLAGIKFTHVDFMDMKMCLEYHHQKFDILHGSDEILICALVLGIQGAIGSTYNYLTPLFKRLIMAFQQNQIDLANTYQYKAMQIIHVLIKYGGAVKAGKSFMRMIGLDLGRPRQPMNGLTNAEEIQLREELNALHFLEEVKPISS